VGIPGIPSLLILFKMEPVLPIAYVAYDESVEETGIDINAFYLVR